MIPSTKDIRPLALGNLKAFRTKQFNDVIRVCHVLLRFLTDKPSRRDSSAFVKGSVTFPVEGVDGGSISMLAVRVG
jgi:hypothetical protein